MPSPPDPTASIEPHTRPDGAVTQTAPVDRLSGPATGAWTTDDPSRPTLPPGYELVQVLGEGGMGYVFQVIDLKLRATFALKVAKPGILSVTARERFRQEAKAMVDLEHPHIARIYAYGEHQEVPFLTMRYLRGGSLAKNLKAVGHDRRKAVELMCKVASATAYLHQHGFVHRDLKPHNILLDQAGEPYVSDFGLVKTLLPEPESQPNTNGARTPLHDPPSSDSKTPHLTATGSVLGTRIYMSPEQTAGNVAGTGPKSDVWALGVILYELLVGLRPFQHHDPDQLAELITTADPEPPHEIRPDFDPALEAIILRCLAKNPADRPTATELEHDLRAWLNPNVASRVWWAAVPILGVAVVGLIWALWQKPQPDPVPPEPTLAELRQPFRDRLARGERVQLVDAEGQVLLPVPFLFDRDTSKPLALGDVCKLEHATLNYAELLDDVGVPSYELYAEAKTLRGGGPPPTAGLYVARSEFTGADAVGLEWTSYFMVGLSYKDPVPATKVEPPKNPIFKEEVKKSPGLGGRFDLKSYRVSLQKDTGASQMKSHRSDLSSPLLAPDDVTPDGWRPLRLRVEPTAFGATFTERPMAPIARPLSDSHLNALFDKLPHAVARDAVYATPGGVGLIVDRGAVLFRNVWIQLLP